MRWDSLGEYLAIAVSFEHMGETYGNKQAKDLGESLNQAIERLLENRKVNYEPVHHILMYITLSCISHSRVKVQGTRVPYSIHTEHTATDHTAAYTIYCLKL